MSSPGKHDINVVPGDTFSLPFRLREPGGQYLDLTGWTVEGTVWHNGAVHTRMIGGVDTSMAGAIRLALSPEDTKALPTSGATWSCKLTTPDGTSRTYLNGRVLMKLPGHVR